MYRIYTIVVASRHATGQNVRVQVPGPIHVTRAQNRYRVERTSRESTRTVYILVLSKNNNGSTLGSRDTVSVLCREKKMSYGSNSGRNEDDG